MSKGERIQDLSQLLMRWVIRAEPVTLGAKLSSMCPSQSNYELVFWDIKYSFSKYCFNFSINE